jgi:transposase
LRAKKLRVTYTEPVRCVVYFNPEMFVRQRLRERKHEQKLYEFVGDLNRRLSSPYSRMDEHAVRFEVTHYLAQIDQLSLYELSISEENEDERRRYQVKLTRIDEQWHKRRKYDGFVLLVAHQQVRQSAAELAYLYRDKDAIEKDFRTIKSELELRPVYHRTDPKVRAHVALCMLALLLERGLEVKLEAAGKKMRAEACLQTLSGCHLNLYEKHELLDCLYSATRVTPEQRSLLKALGLTDLANDRYIAQRIQPR